MMKFRIITKLILLCSLLSVVNVKTALSDDLQTAYQKEFAYLENQHRNLISRLVEFKKKSIAEKSKLNKTVENLQQRYRGMESEAKNLNNMVFESERTLESAKNNQDIFVSTFEQAEETLKSHNVNAKLSDEMASNNKVSALFSNAFKVLSNVSSIRKEKASFFVESGERVEGNVLHIGEIAAYGQAGNVKGILVPAGDGQFKLWQQPAEQVTESLFANNSMSSLKIFLYENHLNAIDATADKSAMEYISSGGLVAWVIIMLGVLSVVLIILRAGFLKMASSASENITPGVKDFVVKKDINGALNFCKSFKGSTSRVVSATLRNLQRDRDHLEDIIAESILHESAVLNKFGAVIIVIAAVTPLLGLLGTVTGMISTFDIITEFGTGDPKLLSGGISVALVTTQLGLVVAIPALIMGNLLSGWSNRIKDDMEKAALHVINIYDAPQLTK
jgi:biopolymer transport protein ExbB